MEKSNEDIKEEKNKLSVLFHNPNTAEETAKYLMKLIMDYLDDWEVVNGGSQKNKDE